ncbi:reverse transcriptase domain-containing protein [Tanacetum coccineum]
MADDRPMAEQLQAPTGGFESAIVVPIINAQNFELKSSLINLVQNRIFRGGNDEEPHAHIRHFESITNNQSYNDQDSLNSAAGGNFLYKSPNEGLQIIENKAKVRCSRNAVMRVSTNAPPPSNSSSSFEFQQMAAALEDKMTLTFRNELNEMKNMMKALVPTPAPVKAVEERCTTCGNNHSFNVCPMTRGSYEYPVYHDNFQQFQQTASVGNFVQNGNSGYRAPNLANQMRPPGFNQPNQQASRPNQGYNANQGKLNDATRKDHFPLPFMDQMLERLAGNEFYCFLDGFSGYFQIPIDPQDQEKTTFTCPYGTFAYKRMPFGLCNAPGTFQRCMTAIFHDMIEKTMEVFMDDFSVFGDNFSKCLVNLDKMLNRCEETNLVLNWEKCHFMVKEGIVLGHKISKNGLEVDRAKVEVIAKLPYPTTVKGVRSFLGHAGFYRRFIQDFSKIARPMTHLLEKETPFVFSDECKQAFNDLRNTCCA